MSGYACPHCWPRRYDRLSSLYDHLQLVLASEPAFCLVCDMQLRRETLESHQHCFRFEATAKQLPQPPDGHVVCMWGGEVISGRDVRRHATMHHYPTHCMQCGLHCEGSLHWELHETQCRRAPNRSCKMCPSDAGVIVATADHMRQHHEGQRCTVATRMMKDPGRQCSRRLSFRSGYDASFWAAARSDRTLGFAYNRFPSQSSSAVNTAVFFDPQPNSCAGSVVRSERRSRPSRGCSSRPAGPSRERSRTRSRTRDSLATGW